MKLTRFIVCLSKCTVCSVANATCAVVVVMTALVWSRIDMQN